jgi:hypothetical protein
MVDEECASGSAGRVVLGGTQHVAGDELVGPVLADRCVGHRGARRHRDAFVIGLADEAGSFVPVWPVHDPDGGCRAGLSSVVGGV